MNSIIKNIKQNVVGAFGWRTDRHILVIESDDWGSIRMPSLKTFNELQKKGVKFSDFGYEQFDTIASCDDLECLFDVCNSYHDINGKPLVITANAVVANPDFDKIKETNYEQYFYEPITSTMQRYYPDRSPFELWRQGMQKGFFHPQLHGREHVNVPMWMNSLKANHVGVRDAFEKGVFSVLVSPTEDARRKNTDAYNYKNESEFSVVKQSIVEASQLFEQLFGYKSKSFIAPSYKWDSAIENVLNDVGVQYIQGLYKHTDNGKVNYNFIGKHNKNGQIYLNRNCSFEYSQVPNVNWIDECLKCMEIAFRWHKPLTINMHRINFIGALNVQNRDNNLKRFKQFMTRAQQMWPDIEFMTSDELGDLINESNK